MTTKGKKNETEYEIVRASMVVSIEPIRIAEDADKHRKNKCRDDKGNNGCSACALIRSLYEAQRDVVGVYNFTTRKMWRDTGNALDSFRSENGRWPTGKEWKGIKPDYYFYNEARKAFPNLASNIVAAAEKHARDKWNTDMWDALIRQIRRPPAYVDTQPIPLRSADVKFVEEEKRDTFSLAFSLHADRADRRKKEFLLPLKTRDQKQYNYLRNIARGVWRMGEIAILRERKDRGKGGGPVNRWFLRIAYKKKVKPSTGIGSIAINRGITCFLVAHTNTGKNHFYDGNDIVAYLNKLNSKRREYQKTYPFSGRRGHGLKRALQPIAPMQARGENWRKTRNQTIARGFIDWCNKHKGSRIFIEDFEGIRDGYVDKLKGGKPVWDLIQTWPFYDLGNRIRSCGEEYGYEIYKVDPHNISRQCPACANIKDEAVITRSYKCDECGFKGHTDVVAATNLLERGERLLAEGKLEPISFKISPKAKAKKDSSRKKKRPKK